MNDVADFFEKAGTQTRKNSNRGGSDAPSAPRGAQATEAPADISDQLLKGGDAAVDGKRRWSSSDTIFWAAKATYDELPAGLYKTAKAQGIGAYLDKIPVKTDDLLILPEPAAEQVLAEFETFWTLKQEFLTRGFLHKRGILLWGPPGSGKTSLIQLMIASIIKKYNGVVVFIDHPEIAGECLQMARKVEPNRPIICILEDLDALVKRYGENEFLALLDGESQVANVVYVATTNYPERLDRRFVDRPSRFDTIVWVGMPNADARRVYFENKERTLTKEELSEWVKLSKGFSIAHLREMIISNRCYKKPIEEVVARLEKIQARKPSSEDSPDRPGVGFTAKPRLENRD